MQRTGGELVLDSLKAAGVDTVFGIISVHNIPIFDAIAREGGVRLVPARTEHAAAAMADGFARATGRLAAAITSTGGGAANAAGPLLEAFSASSPVIHITGQVESPFVEQDKGFLHGAKDQLTMLECVGKAAFRAARTEDIAPTIRTAIELAWSGRPGPVSVEIPIDQQYRAIEVSAASASFAPEGVAPDGVAPEEVPPRGVSFVGFAPAADPAAPQATGRAGSSDPNAPVDVPPPPAGRAGSLDQNISAASADRAGSLDQNVSAASADRATAPAPHSSQPRMAPIRRPAPPAPDPVAVARAVELIAAARKPLIWAGGGVIAASASTELTALAERIGAGVLTSAAGRGSIPEDHPHCIGFFGLEAAVGELYADADLLLAVGTRLRGNETRNWQLPLPSPRIQIDVEPELLGRNYPIDVGIAGDARLTLAAVLDQAKAHADPAWLARVAEARAAVRGRVRSTLGPYERMLDDLRATLPRDAIVVRDVTVPASTWGARMLEVYEPRTAMNSATYAIGMGFGLAIGAAIGQPDREVVLLAGDGGFVTALGELATIAQERAHVRVLLFNDGGYGILRTIQNNTFDGRHIGVDLVTPDFPRMADTFGVWSGQVRSSVELGPLLKEALVQDGPALIEIDMHAVGQMATPVPSTARPTPSR